MKSYLSLIPISAKAHKRQNRMTMLCIIFAVFLVTAIFSMADAAINTELIRVYNNHGNWHISLRNVDENIAKKIRECKSIKCSSWYDVVNYDLEKEYYIENKKLVLVGCEKELITEIMGQFSGCAYHRNNNEIILTESACKDLKLNIGDEVVIKTPSADLKYKIIGFSKDDTRLLENGAIGGFVTNETLKQIMSDNNEISNPFYYLQFRKGIDVRDEIENIKINYNLDKNNISENTALLGITGVSEVSYMLGLYIIAIILFILILVAGILMISASINTSVLERSKFFGMMRCIGASKKQVIRFVTLEALNWCKTSIPIGVSLGVVITWGLCIIMKYCVGGDFSIMPIFNISIVGIVSGIAVGLITVLLAARIPASRAAKVSPIPAMSGNDIKIYEVKHSVSTNMIKIEYALGFSHAISYKKNFFLMISSFAFAIILFLSFSAGISFVEAAIPALREYNPDISIMCNDRDTLINQDIVKNVEEIDGVKKVFGRMHENLEVAIKDKNNNIRDINKIDLISYEDFQFKCAKKDVVKGKIEDVIENVNNVILIFDNKIPLEVGDIIFVNNKVLNITTMLSDSPFGNTDNTPIIICSEDTFYNVTGIREYAAVDIQMSKKYEEESIEKIKNIISIKDKDIESTYYLFDRRDTNSEAQSTYIVFRLFVYGFLAIIIMISFFNIVNSISMGVNARKKQYGAMRAAGMEEVQVIKMIAAEAMTYSVFGIIFGLLIGVPLNKFIYYNLVTSYWGTEWNLPLNLIFIITLIIIIASVVSIYIPSKKIKNLTIIDTINE